MIHHVEHGAGRPVIVLHGAGVDHREPELCLEPIFDKLGGFRRIYPDLPGMGLSPATADITSAEDVLAVLHGFAERVADAEPYLLIGHSAGAYFSQAMAERSPDRVAGLAMLCPLLADARDNPAHRVVEGPEDLGDDVFNGYFVIHSSQMQDRYELSVAPGAALADAQALARIGAQWELARQGRPAYGGPTLIMAGRLDSTAGYIAAADLLNDYPHASLAVLDDTGHALPHEQPDTLRALIVEWLARVARAER